MRTQQLRNITQPLLTWYGHHARVLPWRESPLPYHVWISEIMLQQTRVEAVKPYYDRFMRALPDIFALAAADSDELLKLWEGLGYYNRVRNLHRAAEIIVREFDGAFPQEYDKVLSLPGIGKYTAAAICSIAFGQPYAVVDGNVCRVVARLTVCEDDIGRESTRNVFREVLENSLPEKRAGDFNQALMELGATVCLPNGLPRCGECPVRGYCVAYEQGNPTAYPVKAPKKERKTEKRMVFLLFDPEEKRVALRRRPRRGLLAGMWEFPGTGQSDIDRERAIRQLNEWGLLSQLPQACGEAVHVFTHREWHMSGFAAVLENSDLPDGWLWVDEKTLEREIALPSAFRVFAKIVKQRIGTGDTGNMEG